MTSCCVTGCKNQNCGEDSGVTFFEFPKDKGRKKKWIHAIQNHTKNNEWTPDSSSKICNVHFVSGQPQSDENKWHPDYIPSVFRLLRTIRSKSTPFKFQDEEAKKAKPNNIPKKAPSVQKPKSTSISVKKKGKTVKKKSPSPPPSSPDVIFTPVRKRKLDDIDDDTYSSTPQLKNLSVVLERTNVKKMRFDDYDVKNESAEEYYEYPITNPFRETECKKCETLQARLKQAGKECRRCPVMEHKLKKAEAEIDQMLEEKFNKCEKCIALESKCKRVENNLRRTQTEVQNLQTKLSSVELTEDSFKKSKNKVKLYTGLPNFETLNVIFDHVKIKFPNVEVKSLSRFQMFVIVLMKLKLNSPVWDLTFRFGSTPNIIQAFYSQYLCVLESNLHHVVLWPNSNMRYRLTVLASNVVQNFGSVPSHFEVETLIEPDGSKMSESEKELRVCSAIYHIAQLVTSNHSDQLHRLLNNKSELEKGVKKIGEKEKKKDEDIQRSVTPILNGNEDVDDSDIFFEDLTKDLPVTGNSKGSLQLECQNLEKEHEALKQRLNSQFRFYTGMRNYDVFKNLLSFLTSFSHHVPDKKLTHFQQLHLILIRFKLNLDVQDLSYMFKVDVDHIVFLTRQWIELIANKLCRYVDWPAGIEDSDGEKKLLGTVKLKYQILWGPQLAQRNKKTGINREKINMKKLIRACAALYNIDDIEVFKEDKSEGKDTSKEEKSNEVLEKECRELRNSVFDLRKICMTSICSFYNEETFKLNNDMVLFYTGFPSYEKLLNVFNMVSPSVVKQDRKNSIDPFRQFIFTLFRLKLNLSTQDIGMRFGMCQSNVHKLLQEWFLHLHSHISPHAAWPLDEGDAEVFTNTLWKTYAHLRSGNKELLISKKLLVNNEEGIEHEMFDMNTQVCAGLYSLAGILYQECSDSEFDSFDDDW